MFKFPWGDMHSLNLGWFLQKFNELREDWARAEAGIDGALDAEIQRAEDALSDVFDARDAAAASASAANSSAINASQSSLASMNARDQSVAARNAAQQAATNAAASETAAGNSATAAAGSATAAAGSATAAGNSASNASSSATAAAGSATAAGNSATAAGNSATAAQSAAEAAQSAAEAAQSATNIDSVQYILEALPSIWLKNKYGKFIDVTFQNLKWNAQMRGMNFIVDLSEALDQIPSTALRISGNPEFMRGIVHSAANEVIPLKAGQYTFYCETRMIENSFTTAYFSLRKTENDINVRISIPTIIPLGLYSNSFSIPEDGNYELVLVLQDASQSSPVVEFSVNIKAGAAQALNAINPGRYESLELTAEEMLGEIDNTILHEDENESRE